MANLLDAKGSTNIVLLIATQTSVFHEKITTKGDILIMYSGFIVKYQDVRDDKYRSILGSVSVA